METMEKFHELCDNKSGGILIIIKTDKNLKFGGFTDAAFISYLNPEKKAAGRSVCGNIKNTQLFFVELMSVLVSVI